MKRKNKKKKAKLVLGRSPVALASFDRPGGTHGRRKPNKRSQRRKAIQDSQEES